MTSLEHVQGPVEHVSALSRLSSSSSVGTRDGNVDGDVNQVRKDEVQDGGEDEVVEVGVGLAITTPDSEDDEEADILVIGGQARHQHPPRRIDSLGVGTHEHEHIVDKATSTAHEPVARALGASSSRLVGSAFRLASRSHSGVGSGSGSMSMSMSVSRSRSRSPSDSRSPSPSRSRSRSSLKRALETGEESSATSWTHADVEGLGVGADGPSGDSERQRLSSDEMHADRPILKEGVDVETEAEETREKRGMEGISQRRKLGSDEGAEPDASRKEVLLVVREEDIGEGWHPLRYRGKAPLQDDEDEREKTEEEDDVGSVHALESLHGADRSSETNEKERWRAFGSAGRNSRHLRLEFNRPSSQPSDDGDPPMDRNDTIVSDYYSTLNSKKFETMQRSRRRPLVPHSSYYFGPPPPDSAFGTPPVGQIGVHHPREIIRIERDYVGGELTQFSPVFPLELEGRITPTQFHQTINDINEILISAHSIQHAFVDNLLAVLTLQLSTLVLKSHYTKEMRRLKRKIDQVNTQLYNPAGLHILWPHKVAFLFLEIEYY